MQSEATTGRREFKSRDGKFFGSDIESTGPYDLIGALN